MNKILKPFIFLLLIFLPFQSLLGNFLQLHSSLSASAIFWLSHWYEPFLLIFFLLSVIFLIKRKNFHNWQIFYFILLGLGAISVLLFAPTLTRGLEGFRFALLPLLILLPAYVFGDKSEYRKILQTYVILSILIAVWGITEHFLLPAKYWSLWGIISSDAVFGYGWHTVVGTKQISSVIGGPNQLATYLLPAFFIILAYIASIFLQKNWLKILLLTLALVVLFTAIFFTYSRSAILALIISLLVFPLFTVKNKSFKILWSGMLILIFIGGYLLIGANLKNDLITHGSSQTEHLSSLNQSLIEIKDRGIHHPAELFLGRGLGTAGPAVLKYSTGLIPESWYLQLILELGLLGLFLWLALIIDSILILLKNGKMFSKGIIFGLISVSIASLFLHTWADNPSVAFVIFLILGLTLDQTYEKNLN